MTEANLGSEILRLKELKATDSVKSNIHVYCTYMLATISSSKRGWE
jgi:hypothetical protein